MNDGQKKLIEIIPTTHEPDAASYREGAGLVPALESLTNAATCELDAEGHCITCSDEAVTVQVLRVDSETGMALVTVQNKTEEVDITLIEDVVPGDWLLVHGGVAISNVANAEIRSPEVIVGAGVERMRGGDPCGRPGGFNDTGEANDA